MLAVRRIEAGERPEDVARSLEMTRSAVYSWWAQYRSGGREALLAKPVPGRKAGLSEDDRARLYGLIAGVDPRVYGFEFVLWTRDMVRELIRDKFGLEFSRQWTGKLMRSMGLSPQRPVHRASEQDTGAVAAWREEVFPAIRAEAAQVGARVYFGDEASVRTDYHAGTTWAPVAETPVVEATGDRKSVSMLSAVAPSGEIHFDLVIGTVDSAVFIDFCRKLLDDDGGPVFLVLDNSRVHTSKAVKEFIATTEGKLRLFFLPPYSPQLNPDEWVWKNVKHDRVGRSALGGLGELYEIARKALQRLKTRPDIVKGFFRDPHLEYITAP